MQNEDELRWAVALEISRPIETEILRMVESVSPGERVQMWTNGATLRVHPVIAQTLVAAQKAGSALSARSPVTTLARIYMSDHGMLRIVEDTSVGMHLDLPAMEA